MERNKVVTFGEVMLRLGAPDYLKLVQSNNLDVSFAGAEANVAVSLAHYGVDTDYVTCLPDNPIAEHCIMDLRAHKVGVEHILRTGKRMGVLYLETGSNMRPSKVFYDREYSSIALVEPDSIDWHEVLKNAIWFHWTGITPALSQNAADECLKAIRTANELGVTVSCDINYRGNLWNYGKKAAEVMPELVKGCDLIMGNEEDCDKVFGIKPKNFDVEQTHGDINQVSFLSVCEQMMEMFPRCKKMAVTLRGAVNANHNSWSGILYDGKQLFYSAKYDITDIVDRVGGGDSFMGGLIFGLLYYEDSQKALDFATAASAYKHTLKGDFNWATIEDVETLMSGNVSGRVKR